MLAADALLILVIYSSQTSALKCYDTALNGERTCETGETEYCHALVWKPSTQHPQRRPYMGGNAKGCVSAHRICNGSRSGCHFYAANPSLEACCCAEDNCNREDYFWLTCFNQLNGPGEERCDKTEKPSGACYVTMEKDGKLEFGCEQRTIIASDSKCYGAQNACHTHKGRVTCCCYDTNCNTMNFVYSHRLGCRIGPPKPKYAVEKCPLSTSHCFQTTWIQNERRITYPMSNAQGCDTTDRCAQLDEHGCTAIEETAPHRQTCCCEGDRCNAKPYFWLKCLGSKGEDVYCSYGTHEPSGACFIERRSDDIVVRGCEWRKDEPEKMLCHKAKDQCYTDEDGKTICCCYQTKCNTDHLLRDNEPVSPANNKRTSITAFVVIVATYLLL